MQLALDFEFKNQKSKIKNSFKSDNSKILLNS